MKILKIEISCMWKWKSIEWNNVFLNWKWKSSSSENWIMNWGMNKYFLFWKWKSIEWNNWKIQFNWRMKQLLSQLKRWNKSFLFWLWKWIETIKLFEIWKHSLSIEKMKQSFFIIWILNNELRNDLLHLLHFENYSEYWMKLFFLLKLKQKPQLNDETKTFFFFLWKLK